MPVGVVFADIPKSKRRGSHALPVNTDQVWLPRFARDVEGPPATRPPGAADRSHLAMFWAGSGDLVLPPVILLHPLHFVFQAQLQLLQPHLFHFFLFAE